MADSTPSHAARQWAEVVRLVNYVQGFAIVVHDSDLGGNYERVLTEAESEAWLQERFEAYLERVSRG